MLLPHTRGQFKLEVACLEGPHGGLVELVVAQACWSLPCDGGLGWVLLATRQEQQQQQYQEAPATTASATATTAASIRAVIPHEVFWKRFTLYDGVLCVEMTERGLQFHMCLCSCAVLCQQQQ